MARKALSNKIRFEVFKRDNFTCQYCGRKAPDIVLNVDHIEPVAKGGTNDIYNLATSCFECNNGKSDKRLNDNTIIDKQHDELVLLNERKKQLEQMMQWKRELLEFDKQKNEMVSDYIQDILEISLTDAGKKRVSKWLEKFSVDEIIHATEKSNEIYAGKVDFVKFENIEKIAYYTKYPAPEFSRKSSYIKGIFRNRNINYNDLKVQEWIKQLFELDGDLDEAVELAKTVSDWTEFEDMIEFMIAETKFERGKMEG